MTVDVEFDRVNGVRDLTFTSCLCFPLMTACVGLPFVFCLPIWASKFMASQQVSTESSRVHVQVGWISKTDKLIPIDRIQNITVKQDWNDRMFGVQKVEISTAGQEKALIFATIAAVIEPMICEKPVRSARIALNICVSFMKEL